MTAIIFNGALERNPLSTSGALSAYIAEKLKEYGVESKIFNLADSGIPLFDTTLKKVPNGVEVMNTLFLAADIHFWLAPLYHGSIPGVMKNCLDWLEVSAKNEKPYLTDKKVGLVCWADGVQAMQGINAMDSIAKSLRAWTLPFSVPIARTALYEDGKPGTISEVYKNKLDLLIRLATTGMFGR
ncbi:NADPH-dependent FMN reductase [Elizabethkingia meningoseptica]|uniref:NADPH-dependent FMN reductase n=1 Tax=Elizabethkingia meningoseptica TaxID=238 RepID=UPI000332CE0B|nr:NADPH-dependent FMN reductase [Elizabethkingia meningoseptica]AQX05816.1 NADPH-dependent FMN reductase [Elizabethkingia meningoseptica]AQX47860.1 NADPH-dependent FMN reductase [Elizabethkingia meningoseptica]EOR29939.1 NADPH-dependent FMN reductase [Elizabethkingia meningoseptica ATCC 13253 = NBRC 12535]KUY23049.1 NADPH-dependent FMN reductase [Elizabethkingia meningoseptica]ODM54309.1 NADPH-dependent FMN reductase [Elizabethkingia meningoseptica]